MEKKQFLLIIGFIITALNVYCQHVPSSFKDINAVRTFVEQRPQFKCDNSNKVATLQYTPTSGIGIFLDGQYIGRCEVELNRQHPDIALFGLPWLNGYGPAPLFLYLNNGNPKLELIPVQGEENLSYNSQGYFQHGRTGNKTWMALTLEKNGVCFRPCNSKPMSETYHFIGFSDNQFLTPAELKQKQKEKNIETFKWKITSSEREFQRMVDELVKNKLNEIKTREKIDEEIVKNPMLQYIANFFPKYGILFKFKATRNGPDQLIVSVCIGERGKDIYAEFWKGLSKYLTPDFKIKTQYQSPYLEDAFEILYRKTEEYLLNSLCYVYYQQEYVGARYQTSVQHIMRIQSIEKEEVSRQTIFGSDYDAERVYERIKRSISNIEPSYIEERKLLEERDLRNYNYFRAKIKYPENKYEYEYVSEMWEDFSSERVIGYVNNSDKTKYSTYKNWDFNIEVATPTSQENEYRRFMKANNISTSKLPYIQISTPQEAYIIRTKTPDARVKRYFLFQYGGKEICAF